MIVKPSSHVWLAASIITDTPSIMWPGMVCGCGWGDGDVNAVSGQHHYLQRALQRACTVSLLPPPPRPQRHLAPGRGTRHRPHWPQSQQQHGQYTQQHTSLISLTQHTTCYTIHRYLNSCTCFISKSLWSHHSMQTYLRPIFEENSRSPLSALYSM